MNIETALFGEYGIEVWIASILWSFLGAVIVKVKFLPSNLTWSDFKFKIWINENSIDFIKAILFSIIILRLGDTAINLFEYYAQELPIEIEDFIIFNLFISLYLQYKLHKSRKPKINKDS
jgi:hypothetical protein